MYEAYIFDMDQLVADTSDVWEYSSRKLLEQYGFQWTLEVSEQYRGMDAKGVSAKLYQIFSPPLNTEQWFKKYRDLLIESFGYRDINPMCGLYSLIDKIKGTALLALASGSPRQGIEQVLDKLKLNDYFDLVLSSEEVAGGRGKPAPDVFLEAAYRLEVKPKRCMVFEDSLVGVQAALNAGMNCISVPSADSKKIVSLGVKTYNSLEEVFNGQNRISQSDFL